MPIQRLSPEVVGKIAAGEVLERPANMIKELVENSLDAGADQIEVQFENGGRDVVVEDNGLGMGRDDLPLALERHATSKIRESEDLFALHSFGFRGEALASVAAVAKVTLTSRERGAAQGYRLDSEFGVCGEPVPVAAREGTEVRVSQLFGNVPARQRFLKSEAAEHGQIKTALKALALAHDQVSFRVRTRGDLIFHWPKAATFKPRALDILQLKDLYEGEYESGGIKARVLVSSPDETMNVNRGLWFFVQGRWVQDRSLSAAVMEGYRNLLMHGEYPSAVVRLTLPAEDVDVNVHPTKAQVKFHDPQTVFRVVCRAVREVLERAPWLQGSLQPAHEPVFSLSESSGEGAQETLRFQEPELERTQYSTKTFPLNAVADAVTSYSARQMDMPAPAERPVLRGGGERAPRQASAPVVAFRWADLQIIGQMNQTYIVAQSEDAMYLVDQHAAHERVVFERLIGSFRQGKMDVQTLLLPLVFDFSESEVEALHANRETLEKMGLSLERMGPESVAVQALPSLVNESAISEALQKMAFELAEHGGSQAVERSVGDVFASMACHSVVRAGQPLCAEQMKSLLVQMDEFPLSSFCPHGRPVFVKRKFTELEREFGRLV